jgi:hypothetical protein
MLQREAAATIERKQRVLRVRDKNRHKTQTKKIVGREYLLKRPKPHIHAREK